jgi:CO/xanthine dehydrogenase FAD-binding subunit
MSTRVLPEFTLIVPSTVDEAIAILGERQGQVRILAGGTDILVEMKCTDRGAKTLVKINRLSELNFITHNSENGLTIGALTTIRAIADSSAMKQSYQLMLDAARDFANIQIMNMGTIGGNVCNASPAGDFLPCLLAMNAKVALRSAAEPRTVKLSEFLTGPRKSQIRLGEIVVAITAPALSTLHSSAFVRFTRTAEDLAKVSAAVVLSVEDGKFSDIRIALGSVAPTPIRVLEAEDFLKNQEVTDAIISKAAKIVQSGIKPISDLRSTADYRTDITGVAFKQAISIALARRNIQ